MGTAGLTRCPENTTIFAIVNRLRCITCRIVVDDVDDPTDYKPDESTRLPACQSRAQSEAGGY